jgi:Leucine-rich repeat (LRR) protein
MINNKLFTTFFAMLFLCFTANAQYTAIPDTNFEQALIDQGIDAGSLDGKVLTANITRVTGLKLANRKISNLTGIRDFTAVESLDCGSNSLTFLDVSKNTALNYLDCGSNSLTTLDVSKNSALTSLNCSRNQLTTLDVRHNIALKNLNCSYNVLTVLDVILNTALTYLDCSHNKLGGSKSNNKNTLVKTDTALDVNKNIDLTYLDCSFNQLTALDATKNQYLTYLDCSNNQLITLNIENKNNSNITTFNATTNPNLTTIQADNNTAPNGRNWTKDSTANYVGTLSNPDFKSNKSFGFLYPNPTYEIINIEMKQEITEVVVTNISGNQLIKQPVHSVRAKVDLSSLAEGIYFIKIISANQSSVMKVIKK